jgi:hypothetical protein
MCIAVRKQTKAKQSKIHASLPYTVISFIVPSNTYQYRTPNVRLYLVERFLLFDLVQNFRFNDTWRSIERQYEFSHDRFVDLVRQLSCQDTNYAPRSLFGAVLLQQAGRYFFSRKV